MQDRSTEQEDRTKGTVEWYDSEQDVGAVKPDDGESSYEIRSGTLRDCGIDSLSSGDRVEFSGKDDAGKRTASNIAKLRAFQRWENEGGAIGPE